VFVCYKYYGALHLISNYVFVYYKYYGALHLMTVEMLEL
jgi:hypothetical protein